MTTLIEGVLQAASPKIQTLYSNQSRNFDNSLFRFDNVPFLFYSSNISAAGLADSPWIA